MSWGLASVLLVSIGQYDTLDSKVSANARGADIVSWRSFHEREPRVGEP